MFNAGAHVILATRRRCRELRASTSTSVRTNLDRARSAATTCRVHTPAPVPRFERDTRTWKRSPCTLSVFTGLRAERRRQNVSRLGRVHNQPAQLSSDVHQHARQFRMRMQRWLPAWRASQRLRGRRRVPRVAVVVSSLWNLHQHARCANSSCCFD